MVSLALLRCFRAGGTGADPLVLFMAYQVLARKYRPQRFEDVVGQDHVTRTLAQAIEQKRIAHAYLFCGPRGTGKTTLARIFAKCLNCIDGPSTSFRDDDPRCREIAEGRSLDVLEIDGASNRGIEEIRNLRETIHYAPSSAPYKIYIIDEVHMLTKEAFNALLKTLEEPPEHAKFLFATTEPDKVLPTILSRCQRFALRRIPDHLVAGQLEEITRKEGIVAQSEALKAIARGAAGGMRDAQSTLDQIISFSDGKVEESDVLAMYGMASRQRILQMAEAVARGNSLQVLELLDVLVGEGTELERLLGDLLEFFRNLILFQLSRGNESLLSLSEAEMETIRKLSGNLTPERLGRVIDTLAECDSRIRESSVKRIFLEVALMKSVEAVRSLPLNEVLQALHELQESPQGALPAPPLAAVPPPVVRESPVAPEKEGTAAADWSAIRAELEGSEFDYLRRTEGRFEKGVLSLDLDPGSDSHVARLHRAVVARGLTCSQIRFVPKGGAGRTEAPAAEQAGTRPAAASEREPRAEARKDGQEELLEEPMVKELQDLFDAKPVNAGN